MMDLINHQIVRVPYIMCLDGCPVNKKIIKYVKILHKSQLDKKVQKEKMLKVKVI